MNEKLKELKLVKEVLKSVVLHESRDSLLVKRVWGGLINYNQLIIPKTCNNMTKINTKIPEKKVK